MELQIGQTIEINKRHNIKVKVCEHKNCDGCFFIYKCKTEPRNRIKNQYGECSCLERKDGKNIIFKPVSDDNMVFNEEPSARTETEVTYQNPVSYEQGDRLFFTSDLHLCHDREFIWKVRGFENVGDMNRTIVDRWNSVVCEGDQVYVIGDLMLADTEKGMELISSLNGNIHIVAGNHDTDNRLKAYRSLHNVRSISFAERLRWNGYHFFLTHTPSITGNLEKETLKQMTLNLCGHTHSNDKFFYDLPYVYNVAVDAHDCYPVSVEDVVKDMCAKRAECKKML